MPGAARGLSEMAPTIAALLKPLGCPPRQAPGSFSVDRILENLNAAVEKSPD